MTNPNTFDKHSLLLFAAFTLGTASASWAQSTEDPMKNQKALLVMFAKADKNGDRKLSPEEAKAIPALSERFAQVDTDGDGAISEAEFLASMGATPR